MVGRPNTSPCAWSQVLIWPVELDSPGSGPLETPGVYAHADLLSNVQLHVGGFVVEFTQAGVTINVRRLNRP